MTYAFLKCYRMNQAIPLSYVTHIYQDRQSEAWEPARRQLPSFLLLPSLVVSSAPLPLFA